MREVLTVYSKDQQPTSDPVCGERRNHTQEDKPDQQPTSNPVCGERETPPHKGGG